MGGGNSENPSLQSQSLYTFQSLYTAGNPLKGKQAFE